MQPVTGFLLEHCRPNCPRMIKNWLPVLNQLSATLDQMDLARQLGQRFQPLLYHHIPKIALAGCPNGCSQPRIKDFGIIGYVKPQINPELCNSCGDCVRVCQEHSVMLDPVPTFQNNTCMLCGDCLRACSAGALQPAETGWQLFLGGRVGRHPRFARLVATVNRDEDVTKWVVGIMQSYIQTALKQERLSHFLEHHYDPS